MPSDLNKIFDNIDKPRYASIRDRMMTIVLRRKGLSFNKIAVKLNRSIGWVHKWNLLFKQKGFDGLFDKPRTGAPYKLVKDDEEKFVQKITTCTGGIAKQSYNSGRDFQRLLREEFNVSYSLSGVYNLLQRLWITRISPRIVHYKNDPQKMKEWLEITLPLFYKKFKKNIQVKR